MTDPIYDRGKLRVLAAQALRLDAENLSGLEEMSCDLAGVIMLELDALTTAQLEGKAIDIGRLSDVAKMLNSLRPTQTQTPPMPDFEGSREKLAALLEVRAAAVDRVVNEEIAGLRQEIERLHAEIERLTAAPAPALPKPKPKAPAAPEPTRQPTAHESWVGSTFSPYGVGADRLPPPGSARSPRDY
jgi:uncharacterized small protein (DUF1192 family)